MSEAVIVNSVRTPIGRFQGALSSLSAPELGSVVVSSTISQAGIRPEEVDEVIMGNVLSAGLGQAPARQAAIKAGLPSSVRAVTINKVCGSGLKTVMLAASAIAHNDAKIVIAGGMESMSNAPYLLMKAREGYHFGDATMIDSMIHDGLWDVYNDFHMGEAAELCAQAFRVSREESDQYAVSSYKRAIKAQEAGHFKHEIVPILIPKKGGEKQFIEEDEEPKRVNFNKIPVLSPAFHEKGTVTAANASSISDGAAALLVMAEETALKSDLKPQVRIVDYTEYSMEPKWFTIAPVQAISRLLQKTGYNLSNIDLFEINEAFSCSTLAVIHELGLDPERVNVRGGAVALGHPIGASGARILTTLIHTLEDCNMKRGIASLCIGGGEAVAILVERLSNSA